MTSSQESFDDMLGDPSRFFDRPIDVVESSYLSKSQKQELLQVWETDALELEKASAENMSGGEPSRLKDVKDAIRTLSTSDG